MKKIEVNTHSDRIELETEIASNVMSLIPDTTYYEENEDCVKYTTLGQDIFNGIVDIISSFITVKEDEIEYDLDNDYEELTKEELLMDIYNELIFTDDSYILPDGTELTNFDEDYVRSLEFDTIKHYLK
jgi:hypothetical protein